MPETEKFLPKCVTDIDDMLCGCGNPESVWKQIHEYLGLVKSDESLYRWMGDEPSRLFLAYVLDHMNYTEHGTSIGGCWLHDAGHELLEFLDEHGPAWESTSEWVDERGIAYGPMD